MLKVLCMPCTLCAIVAFATQCRLSAPRISDEPAVILPAYGTVRVRTCAVVEVWDPRCTFPRVVISKESPSRQRRLSDTQGESCQPSRAFLQLSSYIIAFLLYKCKKDTAGNLSVLPDYAPSWHKW